MASSSPVSVGAAFQTRIKSKDSAMARATHVYSATEVITVTRLYEDAITGYAEIEGTFMDGSHIKQTIRAVFSDESIKTNPTLYNTHQRLVELYLGNQFQGTIIQCSGSITMTMQVSERGIKKYFAMEVDSARVVSDRGFKEHLATEVGSERESSDTAATILPIQKGIFPKSLTTPVVSAVQATAQQDPFDFPLPTGLLKSSSSSSSSSSSP